MTLARLVVLAALVAFAGCTEPRVLRPPAAEDEAMERGRTFARSSPAPDSPVLATTPTEELAGPERRAVCDDTRPASLSPEQSRPPPGISRHSTALARPRTP